MKSTRKFKPIYLITAFIVLTSCTINLPGSDKPANSNPIQANPNNTSATSTANTNANASGVASTSTATTPVADTGADQKENEYIASCVQSASNAVPNIQPVAIVTYCECTLNQFKLGATDQQAVVSGCASYAGIPLNTGGSSSSSSSSGDSCGSSYEDQLVCSGVPAAALPHVPPS